MLFGVFDGHAGKEVAIFAKEKFMGKLLEDGEFKNENYKKALENAFMALDAELKDEDYAYDTGSTACVVLITPDKIYCSNAGDSRGVLNAGGKAEPLSKDHKVHQP